MKNRLKRDLGDLQSYATLIGVLVGSGIFVVIGQAGALAGPSVPLVYLAMGPIIISTALAYMVYLSTPLGDRPGGAYVHISRTFNSLYIGYIAVWLKLVAFMGAIGVLSLSFGQYLAFMFPSTNPVVTASLLLLFFYVINLTGVKSYGRAQVIMCAILLLSVIILVVPGLKTVDMANFKPLFPFGAKGFFSAMPPLFMSYAGFEALAQTAGETKDARRKLPRVFFFGISLTVMIYAIMAFVAFGNMPFQELAKSNSAMADVAKLYLPKAGAIVVALGAMMAFSTSINANLMVPPRLLLVLAEDGLIGKGLTHVNNRFKTPDIGLTLTTVITLFLLWSKTLDAILAVTLQAIFLLYITHSLSLVMLPFVNRRLYDSALIKLPVALTVSGGLLSAVSMTLFSYKMIGSSWRLLALWVAIGTGLYLFNKVKNKGQNLPVMTSEY